MIHYLILAVALSLSGCAAWFSVIGLTAVFAGAFWPVLIMASILEAAKVATVAWLHESWQSCSRLLRIFLVFSVITLSGITDIGVFGLLAKAHIEVTTNNMNSAQSITLIDNQIALQQNQIDQSNVSLRMLDKSVENLQQSTKTKDINRAITVRNQQKKERSSLQETINQSMTKIVELKGQKDTADGAQRRKEADFGPLTYIAAAVFGESATAHIDQVVRWLICIIISVFDPLAIGLMIAASHGMASKPKKLTTKNAMIIDSI